MAKLIGELEFWYRDYIEDKYNDSVNCTYEIWGEDWDGLSMEQYHSLCKRFAAAMGFKEKTIDEWFGEH